MDRGPNRLDDPGRLRFASLKTCRARISARFPYSFAGKNPRRRSERV